MQPQSSEYVDNVNQTLKMCSWSQDLCESSSSGTIGIKTINIYWHIRLCLYAVQQYQMLCHIKSRTENMVNTNNQ